VHWDDRHFWQFALTPMAAQVSNALIILGMHRSGTSALTGVLSLLGANSGPSLLPGIEGVNPKGFWEHQEIVAIHERMLDALDSLWADERPLSEGWWRQPCVPAFREALIEIVRRDFLGSPLWVLKDPRMCRLLPLWLGIFEELRVKPYFVICLRHPSEVADSLDRRDGIARERACLLWLDHILSSERWSREGARAIVAYEDILQDWRGTVGLLLRTLAITLEIDTPNEEKVDAFLEPTLRHHQHEQLEAALRGHAEQLAVETFHKVRNGSLDAFAKHLDQVSGEVSAMVSGVAPWTGEILSIHRKHRALMKDFAAIESKLAEQVRVNAALDAEVRRLKSTISWRLTAPLRLVALILRKGRSFFNRS